MTKIGFINPKNANPLSIFYDGNAPTNKYIVRETYWEKTWISNGPDDPNSHWQYDNRTRTVGKYANLASATAHIHSVVMDHDEEGRT